MKHHDSSEMYLETILLLERNKGEVHVKDIAEMMRVSKASVTKAINNLKNKSFLTQENYGPVFLTDLGREKANRVLYKHKVITQYLENDLNLSSEEAEENACRMEHIVTDALLSAIEEKLEMNISDEMHFALGDVKS